MGLFKRCEHKGRNRDRCACPWWGSFQHRGKLHRASLSNWANEDIKSKQQAQAVYDRFRQAVRDDRVSAHDDQQEGPLTFNDFADLYVKHYVKPQGLTSADTIESRIGPLRRQFDSKMLIDIKTADIEDFIAELKQPAVLTEGQKTLRIRRPATINRYRAQLRHMFNWAVEREYLERTPFRRGSSTLIKMELEDNRRERRLTADEERTLMSEAAGYLRPLIITALDTGMRRGEMLSLTWADVEARPGWLRLRGETTKSGKTRWVPISTVRLQAVLDFLRLDIAGEQKTADALVFSNAVGEPLGDFHHTWARMLRRSNVRDLHWHDLRHEYASRLTERGVPLSQVQALLGHASILTTQRYDNHGPAALMEAAKRLEAGESFTIPSHSAPDRPKDVAPESRAADAKTVEEDDLGSGDPGGDRTRDHRIKSRKRKLR